MQKRLYFIFSIIFGLRGKNEAEYLLLKVKTVERSYIQIKGNESDINIGQPSLVYRYGRKFVRLEVEIQMNLLKTRITHFSPLYSLQIKQITMATKTHFSLIFFLITSSVLGQQISGTITYGIENLSPHKIDSTKIQSAAQKELIRANKRAFAKTYSLQFNNVETFYKENVSLATPSVSSSGVRTYSIRTRGYDKLYKNLNTKTFIAQHELYGKLFLIQDSIKSIEWTLSKESKKIAGFIVYKATTKILEKSKKASSFDTYMKSLNQDKKLNQKAKKRMVTITAWYAKAIPTPGGPENYHGLPGMILELETGQRRIIANNIQIGAKSAENIRVPKKGTSVSLSEYKSAIAKKKKEIKERFLNRVGN